MRISLVALALAVIATTGAGQDIKQIGLGVSRLQQRGGGIEHGDVFLSAEASAECPDVESLFFDEAVKDNFAPPAETAEKEHWSQRYWINKKLWSGVGGPIFVFIGGEGAESCKRLGPSLFMYQLAEEHGALLIDIEHRFYGASMPTRDVTTESLRLLSSEQALADLARLITKIKRDLQTEQSRVVTIGGSYPGNLAAYFRLKYPGVTQGSIASSAPLTAKADFSQYMDVVSQSLEHFGGQKCVDSFAKAAQSVADLFEQGLGSVGMTTLEKDFKVCGPMKSRLDLSVLLSDLMGNIQGTIQYNNEQKDVMNAADICAAMTVTDDAYSNFRDLAAKYRAASGLECEDASFEDSIAFLGNTTLTVPANAARSWVYQTCREFGYFQTAASRNQPFYSWAKVLDLSFSLEICRRAFGLTTGPDTDWTNTLYGGVGIDATNIVFVSGSIDPWHSLGITNFTGIPAQPSETAVYISGTAHCADLSAPKPDDPTSLVWARQVIAEQVTKFLA